MFNVKKIQLWFAFLRYVDVGIIALLLIIMANKVGPNEYGSYAYAFILNLFCLCCAWYESSNRETLSAQQKQSRQKFFFSVWHLLDFIWGYPSTFNFLSQLF